jgi:hypothetical protein
MISHNPHSIPHETRVSYCARTDLNRRPPGSKRGALLRENTYNSRVFLPVLRGKLGVVRGGNVGEFGSYGGGFPTRDGAPLRAGEGE